MALEGRRVIVLVENDYQELEFWYPVLRLREAGATVQVVAPQKGARYTSKFGYPAMSDLAASEVDLSETDAVIVPGGYGPDNMRRNADMVRLVRQGFQQGKVVAAICHAGWMLASADVLHGKRATSFVSIKDDMIHAGAEWVDEPVVRDGNLITSRVPNDLPAFCQEIIAAVAEQAAVAGR